MDPVRVAPSATTRTTSGTRRGLVGRLLAAVPVGMISAVLRSYEPAQADGSGAIVGRRRHRRAAHHHKRGGNTDKPKHTHNHARNHNQCNHRCQSQVEPCRTVIEEACARDGNNPECAQRLLPCCEPLATCDAGAAFQCIADNTGG
jgi:hypothetical protein